MTAGVTWWRFRAGAQASRSPEGSGPCVFGCGRWTRKQDQLHQLAVWARAPSHGPVENKSISRQVGLSLLVFRAWRGPDGECLTHFCE